MQSDILSGKKIILGVTGGIAAYKSCYLVRELVKRNAEVRVVMTPSAVEFISPAYASQRYQTTKFLLTHFLRRKKMVPMFPLGILIMPCGLI